MIRSLVALLTSAVLAAATLSGAPVRAVAPVTYYVGHADEALEYAEGSDCAATTYWTDGDGAYDSDDDIVQDVVDAASDGDTIHLCAGTWEFATYVVAESVDLSFVGDGIGETIVDGGATYDGDGERTAEGTEIFVVEHLLLLADMTVQHGGGGSYGAVYGGAMTVERVRFYRNESPDSGGAIWSASTVSVDESEFEENSATSYGGAIWCDELTVRDSEFLDNSVENGSGGAVVSIGDAALYDTDFAGNVANFSGEAFFEQGGGAVATEGAITIQGGTFTANAGVIAGGAILAVSESPVVIRAATLSNNVSMIVAGAVYTGGPLTIDGSLLSGNASSAGGATFSGGTVILRKSRLTSNVATGETLDLLGGCFGGGGAVLSIGDVISTSSRFHANESLFPEAYDIGDCEGFFLGGLVVGSGGAISAGSQLSSNGDLFEENHADAWGGAVTVIAGGFFEEVEGPLANSRLLRSTFTGNSAGSAELAAYDVPWTAAGGAYLQLGGDLTIESTKFLRNFTGNAGGALAYQAISDGSKFRMIQSTFSGNRAGVPEYTSPTFPSYGGAALIISFQGDERSMLITRNTFTGNSIVGDGGGLYLYSPTLTDVTRNTVRGNSATRGGGVVLVACEGRERRIAASFQSSNRVTRNRASLWSDVYVEQDSGNCFVPG